MGMLPGEIIQIWFVSTLLGVIAFPLLFAVSPKLRDRGYSLARTLGLVLVTYFSWILSSLKLLPFGSISAGVGIVLLAALSLAFALPRKAEIFSFLKEKRSLLLGIEVLFIVALAFFLLIISLNPNIDPDSERFMDYALLNSIDRTDYFPPLDPWFAGNSMNYYYYGYVIVTTLHKLVNIPLPVFFNLALGLVYALFTLTCFGLGYNLGGKKSYGLIAVFALALIGNLDGFKQIIGGKYHGFDFFQSARVLVQKTSEGRILDYPINEFPFFSLMWGDLHPYVIAFPLNMMILNLLYNLARTPALGFRGWGEKISERILYLLLLALTIGALFGTNTWDYPIYLALAVFILAFNHYKSEGKAAKKILSFLPPAILLFIFSFFLYAPFNLSFLKEQAGGGRGGIGLVPVRSPLGLFLSAFGIYLIFLVIYLISHPIRLSPQTKKKFFRAPFFLFLVAAAVIIGLSGQLKIFSQTYLLLLFLFLALLLFLLFSPLRENEHFPLILALSALGLAIICEFFFLVDHYMPESSFEPVGNFFKIFVRKNQAPLGGYERMNTVFKIYIHVWLFLGVAAVYFISFVSRLLKEREGLRLFWQTAVFTILFLGFFYPLGALGSRIRGRKQPLTLNGIEYLYRPVPDYQKAEWRWDRDDWEAINWIENNIPGRPVILEATGNAYDWASRVSTFTGLPTLVGWANHEAGWRNDWSEPGRRSRDTGRLYSTTDSGEALRLIRRYNIEYVYVGKLERERYREGALKKFAGLGEVVYRQGPVEIFKVN